MKRYFILFFYFTFQSLWCLAQQPTEIKTLPISPKKLITKQIDQYLLLIDYNLFRNSFDDVLCKTTKELLSVEDREKLKSNLKRHFKSSDSINIKENRSPEEVFGAFEITLADYLEFALEKGEYALYNTDKKIYEKSILKISEEKYENENDKLKNQNKIRQETYYTKDESTVLFIATKDIVHKHKIIKNKKTKKHKKHS